MRGRLPSVTEILSATGLAADFSFVKPDVLEWARARGTALHRAIEYHAKGTLDVDSLHPEIVGAFKAYLRFRLDTGYEAFASELELVHDQWGFMGHPDTVGELNGGLAVIDYKMTASFDKPYVTLQTAGYGMLWNHHHQDRPVEKRFGLHLRKDGTYRLHDVADPEAEQTFLAAIIVYKAQRRK
jgi:hypothetical protein